jgi:hypothetical protein
MKAIVSEGKEQITYSPKDLNLTKLVFDQDYVHVVERRFINKPFHREAPLELTVSDLKVTEDNCELKTKDSLINYPVYMVHGDIKYNRGFLKAVIRPIRIGSKRKPYYVPGAMANMGLYSIPLLDPRVNLQVHVYMEVDGKVYAGGCFANSKQNEKLKAGIYPLEKKLADIKPDFDANFILLPGCRTKPICFEK